MTRILCKIQRRMESYYLLDQHRERREEGGERRERQSYDHIYISDQVVKYRVIRRNVRRKSEEYEKT